MVSHCHWNVTSRMNSQRVASLEAAQKTNETEACTTISGKDKQTDLYKMAAKGDVEDNKKKKQ